MFPVLGGEIVESQQGITILDQALDRPFVFDAIDCAERIECALRGRAGLRHLESIRVKKSLLESKMRESCKHNTRPVAQDIGKRTGESPWLRELDDVSVDDGVSLLCWRSGGVERHHDTPSAPFMPSPTPRM